MDYEAEFGRLGRTANAVGESLVSLGIRGRRNSGHSCPLAAFAERLGIQYPWVERGRVSGDGFYPPVRLPRACRQFMRNFDHDYGYPELEGQQ